MKICIITYDEYINIPYIEKYEYFLKKYNIKYDIILWDRRNVMSSDDSNNNLYIFKSHVRKSKISKIVPFICWRNYTIKILRSKDYDKVIVLTTIPAILINRFLIKNFKGKYIFDIRDYTFENIPVYRKIVDKLVGYSAMTFISSEGFKTWLGSNSRIYLTHNITNIESEVKCEEVCLDISNIKIGFVGGIRYYKENCKLLDALKKHQEIVLLYVGKVHAGIKLKEYCECNNIHNVNFKKEFQNHEKPEIYKDIDIINAVYGAGTPIVNTALPNKLYDCILFKKPIMVSKGTFLAEVIEKFNLGFAIDIDKDNIYNELYKYVQNFNSSKFIDGCNLLINKVMKEEAEYKIKIQEFLE